MTRMKKTHWSSAHADDQYTELVLITTHGQGFVFIACRKVKYFVLIAQAAMSSQPNSYSGRILAQEDDQFACICSSLITIHVVTFYLVTLLISRTFRASKS